MLRYYIIIYDLVAPGRDYGTLWEALGKLDATKILESTWFLGSAESASSVLAHLVRLVDENDRLLVVEVSDQHAGANLMSDLSTLRQDMAIRQYLRIASI